MKYKSLLMLLSIFVAANVYSQIALRNTPSALFSENVRLYDGDSVCVTPQYPSDAYCSREMYIFNNYYRKIVSAKALKAFGIERHEEELRRILNWDAIRLYDEYPYYLNGYLLSSDYYHNLAKIKFVREYACRLLSDMLVDFCNYFPKDFKAKLISELEEALSTVNKCKKHRYECVDDGGWLRLSVDGRLDDDLARTLEGFIARRICMDDIPASEIEDFVSSLLSRIRSTDTRSNPDVMFKVTINNELSYCLGIEGPFFISERSMKRTIPYMDRRYLSYRYYGQKVFYHNDYDGRYYRICNQNCYDGKWEPLPQYYTDIRELFLDAECNVLYQY